MEQLICCSIKVQPARSGPRHLAAPRKGISHRNALRGAKPVFSRLRRPNGVNFNGTAHLLFHQSSASPEWPETPRCAAKRNLSPQRTPGSEANPVPRHGEPLARVPRGETVHWTVSPPLLSLLTLKFFRSLRAATKDSGLISRFGRRLVCAPLAHGAVGICDFLKKIE